MKSEIAKLKTEIKDLMEENDWLREVIDDHQNETEMRFHLNFRNVFIPF